MAKTDTTWTGEKGARGSPMTKDGRRPYVVAILLAGVYSLSFLDRQLLSILAEPVKADLKQNDTQLGLLSGLAFALFYSLFGIPVAWLAD